jgi:hypothetical protein
MPKNQIRALLIKTGRYARSPIRRLRASTPRQTLHLPGRANLRTKIEGRQGPHCPMKMLEPHRTEGV